MTTDAEAVFIEALADAPDDPGPRIVFADYLLERGDPRGEYIRLHHEVTHADPNALVEKRATKLARRETKRVFPRCGRLQGGFAEDGLFWHVIVTADQFFEHAPTLFSLGPIHILGITNTHGRIDAIARSPYLRWVFGLELVATQMTPDDAASLAASPHLARLRHLDVHQNEIGADGVLALAAAPLPALRRLDVGWTALGPDGARRLATAPLLDRLHDLRLGNNAIDAASLEVLLAAATPTLSSLALSYNRFGPDGAAAITHATHLDRLRALELVNCGLGDDGVQHLCAARHYAATLELLMLGYNAITRRGASYVDAAYADFPALRRLRLDGNNLPNALGSSIEKRFAAR